MFVLEKERHIKNWPAVASIPLDDGKVKEEKFKVDLLILDTIGTAKLIQGDEETIKKVLKGWDGIGDKDGKPLEFNAKNVKSALANQFFTRAVYSAYMEASSGQAAEKNS